ncbi:MAG: hypothetical protein DI622_00080 [Chryseobacterium sp.]|nr:MAG: hypothetical protein DI622_00080 [Chryseobacterium sp.]
MQFDMANPQSIDELILRDYYYLDEEDECFFFHVYLANKGYSFNEYNQLIGNFKKKLDRRGQYDWRYKEKAIREVASILRGTLATISTPVTVIPIPPSLCRTDEMYDDRMVQALRIASSGLENIIVRDIISLRENREASHSDTRTRLSPLQLQQLLILEDNPPIHTKNIILIDDVITTGSQFKACKGLLLQEYENIDVTGLFVARTQHDNLSDFDEEDLDWLM